MNRYKQGLWNFIGLQSRILSNALFGIAFIHLVFLIVSYGLADDKQFLNRQTAFLGTSYLLFLMSIVLKLVFERFSFRSLRSAIPDLMIVLIISVLEASPWVYQLYLIIRMIVLSIKNGASAGLRIMKIENMVRNPAAWLMISFMVTILSGAFMLSLPFSTTGLVGCRTPFLDALFTSTSAVCVTGLTVQDTGTYFSGFGQGIILLLIQVGGLGLMTISTALTLLLGEQMSHAGESLMKRVMGETRRFDMIRLVRMVLLSTLAIEFVGAMVLTIGFRQEEQSIYLGVFHSISAFCNAGFSLFPDNLMQYRLNPWVTYSIMGLIVFGGLGFPVLLDINENLVKRFTPRKFRLHTKIVLLTTLLLIVLGTVAFLIGESGRTMAGFGVRERFEASMFQSVTTRTAGFNTIDNAKLSGSSVLSSIILMFVGASPSSTGGGIKTTTFFVLLISVLAIIRSRDKITVFRRTIPWDTLKRVMALFAVSISFLFVTTFILLITENVSGFRFEQVLFEVVSAFGTVGLSMGITPGLSPVGKLIIILLMFLGRVGPLTFIYALGASQGSKDLPYTEENVEVG